MIGIVVVSHSAKLAEGVAELGREMGGAEVRIEAAGGLNLPGQPHGTDPLLILEAIEKAYADEGVLILMDLGSALLSAEMAVEMLPDEKRAHVALCAAPLVEGAVSAAVQARIGSPLAVVAAEARGALAAKAGHLGEPAQATPDAGVAAPGEKASLRLTVNNPLGLHARPAARLVKIAGRFAQTDIRVSNLSGGRGPVSARSINAVTTLGVSHGHELLVSAEGPDAQAALAAIQALADDNFGDSVALERAAAAGRAVAGASLQGLPAAGGIAIGPAQVFRPALPAIPTSLAGDAQGEWARLEEAIARTRAQIEADRVTAGRSAALAAEIFEAHLLYLNDEALLQVARAAIFERKLNAAAAYQQAVETVAGEYAGLSDAYLQARAKDVRDVGRQVLANLLHLEPSSPRVCAAGILIAADLTPAETAHLDPALVLGICTAWGGATSHTAILARSMGIPAVMGLGDEILSVADGTTLVVDGGRGAVWVEPGREVIDEYTRQAALAGVSRAEALGGSRLPAVTRDGRRVEVAANIGSVEGARAAVSSGAEGVGLFRTEFLFLQRQSAPGEEEQYQVYREAAGALAGRPLVIRTLDAGGDKFLPYLNVTAEANPYLGLRAVRLCLARPEVFLPQLRAIVRAAAEFPVRVMFPMVASVAEWRAARACVQQALHEVRAGGYAAPDRIETGIMVEIPAAALCAAQFAGEVDFFSIGTNDLTQYTLAAERGNPSVAALADPFHPAVLELIRRVVVAAHERGKWVGVCGEMAGDPQAIPLLVGLGVDELSMNAPVIAQAKQIIRSLDYGHVSVQALAALLEEAPGAVRERMRA